MRALKLSMIYALLLLVAFSSGALAKTDPLSKANRLPPSLEKKVQDFKQALARVYRLLWLKPANYLPSSGQASG
jgi:hypothetical protein